MSLSALRDRNLGLPVWSFPEIKNTFLILCGIWDKNTLFFLYISKYAHSIFNIHIYLKNIFLLLLNVHRCQQHLCTCFFFIYLNTSLHISTFGLHNSAESGSLRISRFIVIKMTVDKLRVKRRVKTCQDHLCNNKHKKMSLILIMSNTTYKKV